ncbi:MAG: aminoacyl-histidine dipeptidase [Treponema sp.]|uniref:aminoacyl-histidine dipeptidase n=1 Tax=Treponema sp. TaxID=166 RepID=UPI003FA201B0
MSTTIEQVQPKEVFRWFAAISAVPRGSKNEKAISDFLVQFAKERSLEVYQDAALNVIIKKPGTTGYEKSPTVILQGHMDMVCEKTADSPHDFLKDPIKLIVEGDMLHADRTTLGGDDGIAVAYSLAVLDSHSLAHPPLEVLITTNEEVGMDGARELKADHLQGRILFNIDSEEEGIFLVSCAGGANTRTDFKIETEPFKGTALAIKVDGLLGGHSGIEIIKQRANAIKMLGRVLAAVKAEQPVHLVSLCGGAKHNAIAKDAEAVITVEDSARAVKTIETITAALQAEYRVADKGLRITAKEASAVPQVMFTGAVSKGIIDFMMIVPDGVQYMSMDIPNLVQTSLNDGILAVDGDTVSFTISVRSSVKSALDEIVQVLQLCAERTGGSFTKLSEYPAWEYAPQSRARDAAVQTYKEITGKEPVISAIHAGLECGLIKKTIPDIDAVSFGPNLYDVHTPNEHLSISSAERVWKFLVKLLENMR